MPQLPRHPPPASLPQFAWEGPRVRLPVSTRGLFGSPGVLLCGMGTASPPGSWSGPRRTAQLVHVEGVGEPREPCFLFLKIQSSQVSKAGNFPGVPWGIGREMGSF